MLKSKKCKLMDKSVMNITQVLENAKQLNVNERALVAHCLISSLETKQDEGVEQAWAELAERRFQELVSGKVEAVSWDDIKKEVKG
jgi:putative addiction module component (TIGR02574 family)